MRAVILTGQVNKGLIQYNGMPLLSFAQRHAKQEQRSHRLCHAIQHALLSDFVDASDLGVNDDDACRFAAALRCVCMFVDWHKNKKCG